MVGQNSEQGYRGEDTDEFDRGYIVEVQIVDEFQHIYVWRDLTLLFFLRNFLPCYSSFSLERSIYMFGFSHHAGQSLHTCACKLLLHT